MNRIRHATIAYNRLIDLVYLVAKFLFSKIEEVFSTKDHHLSSVYPAAILANHVSELDIGALAIVYRRLQPKIKMVIPTREDFLQKGFLLKEFRPKGLLKFILGLIDASQIIPALLRFIGCSPVKRPFRDNSRELTKQGTLRDQVEKEWDGLVQEIEKGRNLFLFPEGTYSKTGYLNQIKKGPLYLREKKETLVFSPFTLTYDKLSGKNDLYIYYGESFSLHPEQSESEKLALIQKKLGEGFVLHPGNVFSYLLLRQKTKEIHPEKFLSLVVKFITELQSRFPQIPLAKDWSLTHLQKHWLRFSENLVKRGFLEKTGTLYRILEKALREPLDHSLFKNHPLHYYKNQLQYHWENLSQISFDN